MRTSINYKQYNTKNNNTKNKVKKKIKKNWKKSLGRENSSREHQNSPQVENIEEEREQLDYLRMDER